MSRTKRLRTKRVLDKRTRTKRDSDETSLDQEKRARPGEPTGTGKATRPGSNTYETRLKADKEDWGWEKGTTILCERVN